MSDTGPGGLPPAANSDFAQNALLAGGALALLAALAAALGVIDLCNVCGPPDTEIIAASIDKDCKSKIGAREKTLKQKDRDVLVWRIESECSTAQNVLICVDSKGGTWPPLQCVGDPKTAVLARPFPIGAAASGKVSSFIICAPEWPTSSSSYWYDAEILNQDATSTTPLACEKDYELALEVVP